ncbi:MAG: hypothetical protein JWO35_726 [Candidatus Saccharibacteria bacterium]|nr:hypothetical protein [Candidatus Saccharibacteria bacterium]
MANTYVTLDHFNSAIGELKELVVAGFETMNDRFDRLEARVDRLEVRMDALEAAQQETNDRLTKLESGQQSLEAGYQSLEVGYQSLHAAQLETNQRLGRIESAQIETNVRLDLIEGTQLAHYADIKELYRLLAETKRRYSKQLSLNADLNKRVLRVERFANEVAARTGVPYKA